MPKVALDEVTYHNIVKLKGSKHCCRTSLLFMNFLAVVLGFSNHLVHLDLQLVILPCSPIAKLPGKFQLHNYADT